MKSLSGSYGRSFIVTRFWISDEADRAQDGGAIRLCAFRFCHADGATCDGLVFDDDRLSRLPRPDNHRMPVRCHPSGRQPDRGTTIRIGRAGHEDCALVFSDVAHNSTAEPATNVRRVSFFIFLPLMSVVIFLSSSEDRSGIESSAERYRLTLWHCVRHGSGDFRLVENEGYDGTPDQPANAARIRNPSA